MIELIDNNKKSKKEIEDFIAKVQSNTQINFTTSGTTGLPKNIKHTINTITKYVKQNDDNAVWGLTYDHSKIAAAHVIVQALLNNNKLVNLYKRPTKEIHQLIDKHSITHISATPTFYKLNFTNEIFSSVKQITLGGETVTEQVINLVKRVFPCASISNIYALTEFGSVLSSSSSLFKLSERTKKFIKLKNTINVLYEGKWHDTGDLVELYEDGYFKIIGRESSMINVGGYKVNPFRVEEKLNSFDGILSCRVYGLPNSLTGNIVAADIVALDNVNLTELKKQLRLSLELHEVPRILNQVDTIKTNSTGKISRTNE